jgi:hypothetical protein
MQAQMYAVPGTTYMPASLECPNVAATITVMRPRRPSVVAAARLSTSAVQDLLEAVGPLSVEDIAGGLGASVRETRAVVWRMVDEDRIRPDAAPKRRSGRPSRYA